MASTKKISGVLEVNESTTISAQLAALTNMIKNMSTAQNATASTSATSTGYVPADQN